MNKSVILLVIIIIILGFFYLQERSRFPIEYKICGIGYVDCNTIARFEDRDSCERVNEKGGWACDKSDKNTIICKADASKISTGFCD